MHFKINIYKDITLWGVHFINTNYSLGTAHEKIKMNYFLQKWTKVSSDFLCLGIFSSTYMTLSMAAIVAKLWVHLICIGFKYIKDNMVIPTQYKILFSSKTHKSKSGNSLTCCLLLLLLLDTSSRVSPCSSLIAWPVWLGTIQTVHGKNTDAPPRNTCSSGAPHSQASGALKWNWSPPGSIPLQWIDFAQD